MHNRYQQRNRLRTVEPSK